MNKLRFFLTISIALFLPVFSFSQNKQKELEERKKAIIEQIKQISALRSKQAKEHQSTVLQIEQANQKIQARTKLISITEQQANLLSKEINENEKNLETLEKELAFHKKEYAKLIEQSFKSKSSENRLMFLLSSENFWQGYKRLSYMKQYVEYRKKQVAEIQVKTKKIKQINTELISQQSQKKSVLEENRKEQLTLQSEKKELEELAQNIRKKERDYAQKIRDKEKQANAIDAEIQRLIRQAIIESNRKEKERLARERKAEIAQNNAQKTKNTAVSAPKNNSVEATTTTKPEEKTTKTEEKNTNTASDNTASSSDIVFVLTPESKNVANNFEANKGFLAWPVEKGYKSQGFGIYSDPIYPELKHYNNGVSIITEKGGVARSVFEGEVSAIQSIPGSNKVVQIRHGNYISIYYNLTEVFVKKGDKVKTKEALGKIFTDSSGKTEMKFFLYKNTTRLNPEFWIHKM